MASIWRHPKSRYWTACYTDENGRQMKRSTKLIDRNKALVVAQKLEAAYRMKLTEAQARKVVSDIYEQLHGEQLYHATTRTFLTDWIAGKKNETSTGTHKRYQNAVDKLITYLGDRADKDIAYVHKRDLTDLRDKTATDLSVSTANTDLKILRVAFRQAVIDGLRLDNPASAVRTLEERKDTNAAERRPFTQDELKKLLSVATGEWKGLILGGLYTGQRLGDLASLTARRVDDDQELLTFRSQKTGRDMVLPIAKPFLEYLKKNKPDDPDGPLFPHAHSEKIEANGESRGLSNEFHALLVKAKLASARPKDKNSGKGHSVKRTVSALSFHSLRHNTTSWLKMSGVPESVVRDIIGHESELVSRQYTHVDDATKRTAVESLPIFK
ncbi:tyrosine recombinase XerD [mine drainage metagenome]|uniref:Tyrosine recombinase XerD n=1 Tax=mine drainage metagenome TaxID=410659 RepID=A0A1J5QND8_9ZZZZ